MSDFDYITKEDIKKHNPNGQKFLTIHIEYDPCRILIVRGSSSGKRNAILKLTNNEQDIDKVYYTQKIHMKQNVSY